MLSNVSWSEYLSVMVVLLVLYYLVIALKFRSGLQSLFSCKLLKRTQPSTGQPKSSAENFITDPSIDELELRMNDLRYWVFDKAGRQISKTELVEQMKDRLKNYEGLHKPAFRFAINNYIITNAKEICGVAFSEHELNSVWETLSR